MIDGETSTANLSPVQKQLLERLLGSKPNESLEAGIPRLRSGMPVPLSSAQKRIWFVSRMYPGSAEYNVLGPLLIFTLDASREHIETALRKLMERHDALRVQILEREESVQVECSGLEPPLVWHDLSGMPIFEAMERAAEIGSRMAREPFKLDRAPLFRVLAIRLADGKLLLFMLAHHIVVDGWSMDLLYDELHTLMSGGEIGPAPSVRYLDYVSWEQANLDGQRLSNQMDYWKRKLGGGLPLLDIPKDRPWTTIRSRSGHAVPCSIPPSIVQQVKELAEAEGTTLFVVMLAAYEVLLLRLTGQTDLIVGTPFAGRDHAVAETLVGSFARVVGLRTDLGGDLSFREVVRRVNATTVEAQDNQLVPFERIVAELKIPRELNCSPIFQTVFALHTSSGVLCHFGAEHSDMAYDSETSKWELSLSLIEFGREVSGFLEYSSDLYDRPTVARYLDIYTGLLAAMAAEPDRPVNWHALVSANEKMSIPSASASPFPSQIPYATLAEPFEQQVKRTPEAIALVGHEGTLTYHELNEEANRLAHLLREQGVVQGSWVAVCMERGFALVTALYAIAKTGAAYVPMEPQLPGGRIQFQLEDTGSRLVITHVAAKTRVPAGPWRTICLEEIAEQLAGQSTENLTCDLSAGHLAYLMYTSGSTGRPKAVAFPVDAALSSVFWMQRCYPVLEGERHILKTPYSFDVSLWELFFPLYFGGTLVVCRPDGHLDPKYLADQIEQHQVRLICFVPSMLQAFLDEIAPNSCRSLRWVHCGGEALTPRLRDAYHKRLQAKLINGYGPTETHAVTFMEIAPDERRPRVPLGRAAAGYRLYVLDEQLHPQPIGVPGELYIGGEVGLAQGYFRRPGLTAERFLPDPFGPSGGRMYRTGDICRYFEDGILEHLGRCDTQVKLRGVRVEAAEIESVLCEHELVRAAVVLLVENESGESLVGFVVPQGPIQFEAHKVIQHAASLLPRHMLPASIVCIEQIPTTPNGKIDREALLARWRDVETIEIGDVAAPEGEGEKRLQRIFQRLLGLESVSVTSGFFDLGGHSLLIFKLISACEQEFGIRLTAADIFVAQSVRELAAKIASAEKEKNTCLVPLSPQHGKPIVVFIHAASGSAMPFINLANSLGSDFSIFALQAPGLDDEHSLVSSIDGLAANYVELIDSVRSLSPLIVAGWSMGGCVALEMARQWQRQGVAVAALIMIDSWTPPGGLDSADARDEWRNTLLEIDFLEHERESIFAQFRDDSGAFARLERVLDSNRLAFVDYEPVWFDGEVDFLRAAEAFPGADRGFPDTCLSMDRGWGRHVRQVTVHPVAGDHFSLIAKENAASLANTVRRIVDVRLSFSQI